MQQPVKKNSLAHIFKDYFYLATKEMKKKIGNCKQRMGKNEQKKSEENNFPFF